MTDRAAATGLLPDGGLTPREQCAALEAARALPPTPLRRVLRLLDRCVYGRAGSEAERIEGRRLCDELAATLPDPPFPPRPGVLELLCRMFAAVAQVLPWLLIGGVVIALLALMLTALGSLPGAVRGGLPAARVSAGFSNANMELSAINAAAGSWATPASNPRWISLACPQVIDEMTVERRAHFDTITGVDAIFRRAGDPFDPPLGWSHRLLVYPAIDGNFNFHRAGPSMVAAGGAARSGDDLYDVSVRVTLSPGAPLPVPSPAADTRVLTARGPGNMPLQFVRDRADGLHVISSTGGRFTLRYRVACDGSWHDAPLPDVPFAPRATDLPPNVRADGLAVAEAIGGLPAPTYRATVRRLHAWFAGFRVSPLEPGEMRANEFLTIALARKGVCRHRARTFFVVANAVGVRTRLVENRIHSFCEVQLPDGRWRRLEFRLGEDLDGTGPRREETGASMASSGGRRTPLGPVHTAGLLTLPFAAAIGGALLWLGRRRDLLAHVVDGGVLRPVAERRARLGAPSDAADVTALQAALRIALMRRFGPHERDERWPSVDALPAHVRRSAIAALIAQPATSDRDPWAVQRLSWECDRVFRWLARDGGAA